MKNKPSLSLVLYALFVLLFLALLISAALNDDGSETKSIPKPYYAYYDVQPPELPTVETFQFETIDLSEWQKERSYIITYSARLESNNHVGDSWGYGLKYDDEYIESGSTIKHIGIFPLSVRAYATEFDDYNDYGSTYVTFRSLDVGEKQSKEVTVTVSENKGRYAGNTAQWGFYITVERIS